MNIRQWAALGLIAMAGAGCAATQTAQPAATQAAATSTEAGRDWSRIDTNRDGSVSPEEMEKYLAENPGPLRK